MYGDKRSHSEADDAVVSLLERIILEKTRDVSEADSEADQQDVADENNNEDDFRLVFLTVEYKLWQSGLAGSVNLLLKPKSIVISISYILLVSSRVYLTNIPCLLQNDSF